MTNKSYNKSCKWLITGGAGFIGSHLVEKFVNSDNQIICIDDISTGYIDYLPKTNLIKFEKIKIQDLDSKALIGEIDGIFHLAAQASVPLSLEQMFSSSSNNLLGTLKVWELAKLLDIPIVYASSSAVYGNLPLGNDEVKQFDILSPYARDKLTMEDYAKMCWEIYKVPSIGLRFFNVYGPRQDPSSPYSGVISVFIDRLLRNKPITINGGYQTRDFIFVDDIVKVMNDSMKYLFNNRGCQVFNVGTGVSYTINQLLAMIADNIKVEPEIILKKLAIGDPKKSGGTYAKLENIMNVDINKFVKLKDGLNSTIQYIRKDKNL